MLTDRQKRTLLRAASRGPKRHHTVVRMPSIAVAVGAALRAARRYRGLSQREVAEALGRHRPIIARTEAGRHTPELSVLAEHMRVVGMKIETLAVILDAALR